MKNLPRGQKFPDGTLEDLACRRRCKRAICNRSYPRALRHAPYLSAAKGTGEHPPNGSIWHIVCKNKNNMPKLPPRQPDNIPSSGPGALYELIRF